MFHKYGLLKQYLDPYLISTARFQLYCTNEAACAPERHLVAAHVMFFIFNVNVLNLLPLSRIYAWKLQHG